MTKSVRKASELKGGTGTAAHGLGRRVGHCHFYSHRDAMEANLLARDRAGTRALEAFTEAEPGRALQRRLRARPMLAKTSAGADRDRDA